MTKKPGKHPIHDRIHAEMLDSFDEELELEIDDDRLDASRSVEARTRWEHYTKAKEAMLERTHISEAPWYVVQAVDKKKARLNCIAHLLEQIPYDEIPYNPEVLPARVHNPDYHRGPVPPEMYVLERY